MTLLTAAADDTLGIPIEICVSSTGDGYSVYAVRDETDRRAAEAQLLESERRYRELAESTHDLICDHDLDGKILSVNPAAARALGIAAEELCTMSIRDVLVPEAQPLFDVYLGEVAQKGVAEGLMVLQTRGGERRTWHYRNALRLSGMECPVIRGLAHDVTEREDALSALRHSEHHFRSIIENASDIIGIIDSDGRLTYHSPSTERVFGSTPDQLHNRHFAELVHREDAGPAEEFFRKHIESPKLVSGVDLRMRHRDGAWRWLSIVGTTIETSDGTRTIIVNGRDVTDRRRLEEQLEQANRLTSLGQLTATVAHEFNNVLMAMQPFADLLQRPNVSRETIAKGAFHIANSIARGKRVAQDMLRFARPAEPTIVPLDLSEWWERLVPELQAPTGNNIDFSWSFDPSLRILGDAAQLSQVFANLISNARDAMPCGGTLRVIAQRSEKSAHISVQDSGTGMPEHVRRHAFDPLFTTKRNGGTGLGLAVAHQVVTRHGGTIFIDSEPGRGTTFHLHLPLTDDTRADAEEQTERTIAARRILIVEDEPSIAEGTAMALRDRGLTVVTVCRGGEAEAAAKQLQPDVALIDIRLPDADGTEVARRLRVCCPQVKIVFASGHADEASVRKHCARSMFLQKPFEIADFLNAVAMLEDGGAA